MSWLKLSTGIAIVTTIASLAIIMTIPETTVLPLHWTAAGEVDKTVNAHYALMFPPLVMWIMIALVRGLNFLEPRKTHLRQSAKAIGAISASIVLLMLVLEAGYIALLTGAQFSMHLVVVFSIGVALMIIGNYIGKTRSNYFIGIRTPWTLSSDEIWQKTHRKAAPVFIATGAILAVMCWFIDPDALTYLILALLVPVVIYPTVYSWWLWKQQTQ